MRDTPARIVIRGNEAEGAIAVGRREDLAAGILVVIAVVCVVAGLVVWKRHRARSLRSVPAADRACRTLSRSLGLDRASMRRVEALGARHGVEPLGLLVAPTALRAAMDSPGEVPAGDRVWSRLEAVAGG